MMGPGGSTPGMGMAGSGGDDDGESGMTGSAGGDAPEADGGMSLGIVLIRTGLVVIAIRRHRTVHQHFGLCSWEQFGE